MILKNVTDFLKVGDMLLTNDQMEMFFNKPDLNKIYFIGTEWLWLEFWNAAESKYIIPYTDHPVPAAQESSPFGSTKLGMVWVGSPYSGLRKTSVSSSSEDGPRTLEF